MRVLPMRLTWATLWAKLWATIWATLLLGPFLWTPCCRAQANTSATGPTLPDAPQPTLELAGISARTSAAQTQTVPASEGTGSLSGDVTDISGALVPEAALTLTMDGTPGERTALADSMGKFAFKGVAAGSFHLKVTARGMQAGTANGKLGPGEALELPAIVLHPAEQDTEVEVTFTQKELGEAEVQAEEKQRLLGIVPNFSVSYDWNAPPMTTKQKYAVAARLSFDPVSIILTGGLAGYQLAREDFYDHGRVVPGWNLGAAGYFKRFGADMATGTMGTFISGALLPEVFHQDPRYFWKGSGTIRSRLLYALSTVVICRNDRDGHWMPNYSNVVGNFTAGAISNFYFPAGSRTDVTLTIENGFEAMGFGAVGSVIQEFVLHRMTPKLPPSTAAPAGGLAPPAKFTPDAPKAKPKPADTPPPPAQTTQP